MAIEYRITLDDKHDFSYRIELDREYDREVAAQAPKWTRLDHQRCSNCPLSKDDFSHCPAAVDLHRVIEDFQGLPAVKKALVWVRTPEREYTKLVGLDEGVACAAWGNHGDQCLPRTCSAQTHGQATPAIRQQP